MSKPTYKELEKRVKEFEKMEEECKQVERNLKNTLKWYEVIFEGSRDAIFISDTDSKFISVNNAACELTGYSKDELLRMKIPEIHEDVDLDAYNKFFNRIMAGEKILSEAKILRKDGTKVDIEFNNQRIEIQGKPFMHTVARDVSERKKTEEELKLNFSLLSSTMESTADGILVVDLNGKTSFYNEKFRKLWQISEKLAQTKDDEKMLDFVLGQLENPQEFLDKVKYLYEHKKLESFDTLYFKDGRIFERYSRPQYIGNEIVGRVWSFRDVTDRKKAEQALKRSENKHRTYVKNAPNGIFIVDSSGKYVDVNDSACKMTGYSIDELLEMSISQLLSPKAIHETNISFENLKQTGKVKTEILLRRKDGTHFYVALDAVALSENRFMAFCSDITERKKVEEALQENQKYLVKAQQIAKVGSWAWESGSDKSSWSDQTFHMLGYAPNEIQVSFEWLLGITHPDDVNPVTNGIEESMKTGKPYDMEYRLMRKDGKEIVVHSLGEVILNEKNESTGMIGVIHDITERKKAEEELEKHRNKLEELVEERTTDLKESEEKYRMLFEGANDAIYLHELTKKGIPGRFLEINDVACKRMGYTREEFLEMTPKVIDDPALLKKVPQNVKKLQKEGRITFEFIHVSKDGKKIPVEISSNLFKFKGKNVVLSLARDITERKKAEQDLKESESMLQKSQEIGKIGSFEMNLATGNVMWSDQLYKLFDLKKKERYIDYEKVLAMIHPDDREHAIKVSSDAVEQGKSYVLEHRVIHSNGEIRNLLINGDVVYNENNEKTKIVGTIQDITDRKKSEESLEKTNRHLRQSERLAATGRLAASIAHEINNPAQAILFNLGFIKRNVPADFIEKKAIEQIEIGLLRIRNTVKQLLDIHKSKINTEEKINVNEVINSALALLQNQLLINKIDIKKDMCREKPLIYGLSQELFQVFLNLFMNAQDAMKNGGVLHINTKLKDNKLRIAIKDAGSGIAEKDIDHIFEPFYTTKSAVLGTGLGLSTSKGIIESMGGEINVKSAECKGAEFTITFPTVKEDSTE